MNRFATRVVVLFALVATFPVALTAVVWLGVSHWGAEDATQEAEMVRRRMEELDAQREAAVTRLCRDDLAIDQLLESRSEGAPADLDYDRLLGGAMDAAGLQVLWVMDAATGEVIAAGHRNRILGNDGSELARQAKLAGARSFVLASGDQDHQRFLVRACTIVRGGVGVTVVGGHRLSALRSLDPEQIMILGEATSTDETIAELIDAEGAVQSTVVWRPRIDRRAPPLLLWIACVALLALGLALIFGGYLNRWLQASIDELTAAAARIGAGDFDTTVGEGQAGAFQATATAFNRMTRDLRDAQEQLRQSERIAAWQEIAKRLAHELKNPLSPIRLSIETLRKAHARSQDELDALFDESTKTILQEVERLRHIVDEFSRFARLPAPRLGKTDLREVVTQATSLYVEGDVALTTALPDAPLWAVVDADQVTQVLHNLLQNARDSALEAHPDGGGRVRVSLEAQTDALRLQVEDNGPGIPADREDLIFEPYFTSKEGGTGLGLAITHRIITEHGGRIEVNSIPGRTVFTVVLPRG